MQKKKITIFLDLLSPAQQEMSFVLFLQIEKFFKFIIITKNKEKQIKTNLRYHFLPFLSFYLYLSI